jgi:hypothetical protein
VITSIQQDGWPILGSDYVRFSRTYVGFSIGKVGVDVANCFSARSNARRNEPSCRSEVRSDCPRADSESLFYPRYSLRFTPNFDLCSLDRPLYLTFTNPYHRRGMLEFYSYAMIKRSGTGVDMSLSAKLNCSSVTSFVCNPVSPMTSTCLSLRSQHLPLCCLHLDLIRLAARLAGSWLRK